MDGIFGTTGTVGHGSTLPAYALSQRVAEGHRSASIDTLRHTETARILRAHRLDELLDSIRSWAGSTCIERAYWRSTARWQLAEFRRLHLAPERAAFMAAVARSRA